MSLALSTLIYEWRRYMAAVVALAFSGLLVLAQVGMFVGIGQAFSATIDRSPADIMVLGPKAEGLFDGGASLPRPRAPHRLHAPGGGAGARPRRRRRHVARPRQGRRQAQAGVRPDHDGRPLPGLRHPPHRLQPEVWRALQEPYAVAIDKSALARLGVKLGDKATLNGKTVRVRAVIEGYPNMMQAMVVMSRDTLRLLGWPTGPTASGPLMVKLKDPSRRSRSSLS
jgi:putative ABC transport system permease protein